MGKQPEFLSPHTSPHDVGGVQDIAYDYYENRLVTVSINREICIWKKKEKWYRMYRWKAHEGPVFTVSWSHPCFKSILATGSYDKRVIIWEEPEPLSYGNNNPSSLEPTNTSWNALAHLVDARDEVRQVEFAPPHLGLLLASGSADGYVRIYNCMDVADLHQWPLLAELDMDSPVNALSWNPSVDSIPSLVVASNKDCRVWWMDKDTRRWTDYCLQQLESETLTFSAVAWAPHVGRSFERIAVGCADGTIQLFQFPRHHAQENMLSVPNIQPICTLSHGTEQQRIVRLQWNFVGSILASSANDGKVCLWKPLPQDWTRWSCFDVIPLEQVAQGEEEDPFVHSME
ncbi:hypothetical protein GAYE_SCF62G6603 [Galdieria yellowstonensis]|uniref:Uncharacterized protein n=1 Tax=Galdieria yellowstonensis TaxID=3028027 RepID=A0AAV9IMY3_9RHOD|nr:hypothetical protein GAYE_SCF62G6603 [Galdieria yellowstonensis]